MNLPTRISYPVAVIGDVHGQSHALGKLLAVVEREIPGCNLGFVGDFVDRGPDTKGVLDTIIALVESGKAAAVCGNHDYALVRAAGLDDLPPSAWWIPRYLDLYNAGATFRSYMDAAAAGYDASYLPTLKKMMPQAHREFLSNLPWAVTTTDPASGGGHMILHAGLSRDLALTGPEQLEWLLAKKWNSSAVRAESYLSCREISEYPPWLGSDRRAAENPLPMSGWVQIIGHDWVHSPKNLGHAIRIDTTGGGSKKPLTACILDAPNCEPRFVNSAQ